MSQAPVWWVNVVGKFFMVAIHLVFRIDPSKKNESQPLSAFYTSLMAPGAKLSVAEISLIFGGGGKNIW